MCCISDNAYGDIDLAYDADREDGSEEINKWIDTFGFSPDASDVEDVSEEDVSEEDRAEDDQSGVDAYAFYCSLRRDKAYDKAKHLLELIQEDIGVYVQYEWYENARDKYLYNGIKKYWKKHNLVPDYKVGNKDPYGMYETVLYHARHPINAYEGECLYNLLGDAGNVYLRLALYSSVVFHPHQSWLVLNQ